MGDWLLDGLLKDVLKRRSDADVHLGRGFDVVEAHLFGKGFPFGGFDLPFVFQVNLSCYQNHMDTFLRVSVDGGNPALNVDERRSISAIEGQDDGISLLVISVRQRSKPLHTSGVPDLHFELLSGVFPDFTCVLLVAEVKTKSVGVLTIELLRN